MGMKDARLHIVGLESLDDTASDPSNPDMVNKAWFYMFGYKVIACPKAYSHDCELRRRSGGAADGRVACACGV